MSETATKTATLTKYRVLISGDGGRSWILDGQVEAHGTEAALRTYFPVAPTAGSLVVAVAERSFQPVVPGTRSALSLTPVSLDDVDAEEEGEPS